MSKKKGRTPKKAKHPRIVEAELKKTLAEKDEEFKQQILKKMADPTLLVDIVKEVQKEVSGEEDTITAEIITTSTRLVKNAIPESTNLLLSDKTGLGKDYITKKTLEVIIPEDELLHVTKMSPESFIYWHYKDESWTWDKKVIHFEDVTQNLLNCPTFKIMSSGGSYAVVVKDQKTIEIPIPGKPCMILTSHHANPRDEALRRFRIGALNETEGQTRAIKDKISSQYTGNKKTTPDYVLRSAVQSLEPYSVIIPYAELIQHFFPDDSLMRTHYHCFLDFICGSAIFHQCQREKSEDGFLIATPDDYMIAKMVLLYTTSNPKMIPMSREYRDIIEILKDNVEGMTVKEIDIKCSQSRPWLYKHLPNLVATGLVSKGKIHNESANKDVITYRYADVNPNVIPTWNEIGGKIEKIVNKTNNTNKTTGDLLLEKWFSTHDIKPIKPKNEKEGFSLVLYGHIIPFNRKVLSVFSVLCAFLCERDEKRYKKYYEEPEPTEGKPAQYEKIQKIRKEIESNRKAGYAIDSEFLYKNFDHGIIDGLTRSGQLIKQGNGEYVFGGS